jgi:hypothetical protein
VDRVRQGLSVPDGDRLVREVHEDLAAGHVRVGVGTHASTSSGRPRCPVIPTRVTFLCSLPHADVVHLRVEVPDASGHTGTTLPLVWQ